MTAPKPSPAQRPKSSTRPSATTSVGISDLTQPGPEHAQLMKMVGSWDVTFTQWTKEDEPEKEAQGSAVITAMYDGRYICEEYSSDFAGKSFRGVGTTGYDRGARHFVTTWCDNMGTGIVLLTGTPKSDGQEIVYHGTMTSPQQQLVQLRHVVSWESDDRFTITMFSRSDDEEHKSMFLTYTRRA